MFPTPQQLATSILDRMPVAHTDAPLPDHAHLSVVLDVALECLLRQEEGRPILFSLLLADHAHLAGYERNRPSIMLPFEPGVKMDALELAKLALSTDCERTQLGIERGPGGPRIWGLCAEPQDYESSFAQTTFPYQFAIRGVRPGGIIISYAGAAVGMLKHGHLHWSGPEQHRDLGAQVGFDSAPQAAPLCIGITERIAKSGHGGTLLVASDIERALSAKLVKYRFQTPDSTMTQAFADRGLSGESLPPRSAPAWHRYLASTALRRYAVDHIARLANVDGAVMLDPELRAHGFGARIPVDRGDDLYVEIAGQPIPVVEVGGMRHQSAATFCARAGDHETRMAFVASQDRRVSIFHAANGVLRMHKHVLLAPG